MKHSDEIIFADCFKSIENVYRAIFSVAVMCRWIAEHNTVPTDAEAVQMEMEIKELPEATRTILEQMIATEIANGHLDSIAKVRKLSEIFDSDFNLLSELFVK